MREILATAILGGIILTGAANAKDGLELSIGVGQESETSDKLVNIGYAAYLNNETARIGLGLNGSFSDRDNPYVDALFYLGFKHKQVNIEAIGGVSMSSVGNEEVAGTTFGGKVGYAINDNHKFEAVYLTSKMEDANDVAYDRKRTNINYVYSY